MYILYHVTFYTMYNMYIAFSRDCLYNITIHNKGKPNMSCLQNEILLEQCFEEAVEDFCTSNKLTPEMFATIENHLGVQIALDKLARQKFEGMIQ